jgi:hypothetical protein
MAFRARSTPIAHGVGSYKDKNSRMADKKWTIQTSTGRINKNKKAPAAKPLGLGSSAPPMRGFFISPA